MMMNRTHFIVHSPESVDSNGTMWMSQVTYSKTISFPLMNVPPDSVTITDGDLHCSTVCLGGSFEEWKTILCDQIADKSTEWFRCKCTPEQIASKVHIWNRIKIDNGEVVCLSQDELYDDTLHENTVTPQFVREEQEKIANMFCSVYGISFQGQDIYLHTVLSHIRLKAKKSAIIHHNTEEHSDHILPSKEELDMIHARVEQVLRAKNAKLSELTAIEQYLHNEFVRKTEQLKEKRKNLSNEIYSLEKTKL